MANLSKKMKPLISGLIVVIIIFSLAVYFAPKDSVKPKSKLVYDETINTELAADAVHPKDLVTINYVLSLADENNKVIDTNDAAIAKQYGLKTFASGPMKLIAGKSGKVKGFDKAIIGMKVGENKEVIIPPSEPPTRYLLNKTREFSRNQPIPKNQVFPIKTFKKLFGDKTPKVNDILFNAKFPWKYQVLNVSSEAVGATALVTQNQEVQLPGLEWKSVILQVGDRDFVVRHNPKDGQLVNTTMGPATVTVTTGKIQVSYDVSKGQEVMYAREVGGISNPHLFKVLDVTDQKITLEREDNPAEKRLKLNITLLDRSAETTPLGLKNSN